MGMVYLVRHGNARNPRKVAYGFLRGFPLSERGRREAEVAAEFLADRPVSRLYASPLQRARQTAAIIAARHPGVAVRRSPLLRESEQSRLWQGHRWEEMPALYPERWRLYQERPGEFNEGESLAQIAARLARAVVRAARDSGDRAAVCVSHRDPIVALRLWASGGTFDLLHELDCATASVTAFELTGEGLCERWYWRPRLDERTAREL